MKHFLLVCLVLMSVSKGYSWGALGHKTSAQVAWQFLDQNTKDKLNTILKGSTISDASVWADAARQNAEWKFTIWYHFEKAPDNTKYLDMLKQQTPDIQKKGGLLEALFVAEETIKDKNATDFDKENAIKFIIHFIGDIHQPLHTGRVEDNGGNKIPKKWLGFDMSLHSVWDSQIIYLGHKDLLSAAGATSNESADAYANYLVTKYHDLDPTEALAAKYDDWMHESMVPRTDAYTYANETEDAYTARFVDVVDKRIYLAGLRIAYTLKRILSTQEQPSPLQKLRASIVKIVGDFTTFVSLKPRAIINEPPTDAAIGLNK